MRVLIACEESQTECMAFRSLGHEAYSCDIKMYMDKVNEWKKKRSKKMPKKRMEAETRWTQ